MPRRFIPSTDVVIARFVASVLQKLTNFAIGNRAGCRPLARRVLDAQLYDAYTLDVLNLIPPQRRKNQT